MDGLQDKGIILHPHFVKRWMTRGIDLDKVEETIKTGIIKERKGKKLTIERYFGKDNETYIVICLIETDFVEVLTSWKNKGR